MGVFGKPKNTLLTGLSDFWQRLFRDTDVLEALYAATEVQLGQAYLDMLTNVLNVNIRQTPVFNREYWKLVTLREDLVRFEGTVVAGNDGPYLSCWFQDPDTDTTYDGWIGGERGTLLISSDDGVTWAQDASFPKVDLDVTGMDGDQDEVGATGNVAVSAADLTDPNVPGRAWIWLEGSTTWLELDNTAVDRGLLAAGMNGASDSGNFGRNPLFVGYDGRMYYSPQKGGNPDILQLTGDAVTGHADRGNPHLRAIGNADQGDGGLHVVGDVGPDGYGTVIRVQTWVDDGIWEDGVTWQDMSSTVGATENLHGCAANYNVPLAMVVCGENNTVYGTFDCAVASPTWTDINPGSAYDDVTWLDAFFGEANPSGYADLFLLGDDGTILRSPDWDASFPLTWEVERAGDGVALRAGFGHQNAGAVGSDGYKAWTVGDDGQRVYNLDYGDVTAWTETSDGTQETTTGAWKVTVDDDVVDFLYLQNRVYDPSVILERDVDFIWEDEGVLTFTSDPFEPLLDGVPTRQVAITPTTHKTGTDGRLSTASQSTFVVSGLVRAGVDGAPESSGTTFDSATANFSADDVGREIRVYRTGDFSSRQEDRRTIVAVLTSSSILVDVAFSTWAAVDTAWEVFDATTFTQDDVGNEIVLTNPFTLGETATRTITAVAGNTKVVTLSAPVDFGQDATGVIWTLQSPSRVQQYAFWAPDALIDNENLYNYYGYLLDRYEPSSESYKAFLEGVLRFYVEGPSLGRIESVLNAVSGVPLAREDGEVIASIDLTDPDEDVIITNRRAYGMPKGSIKPTLAVGDEINAFQSLSQVYRVEDRVSDPTWYWGETVPEALLPDEGDFRRNIDPKLYQMLWGDTRWQFGEPGLQFGADGDGNLIPSTKGLDGLEAIFTGDPDKFGSYDQKFFSHHVGRDIWVGDGEYTNRYRFRIVAVGPASGSDFAYAELEGPLDGAGGTLDSLFLSSSDYVGVTAVVIEQGAGVPSNVIEIANGDFTEKDVGRLVRVTAGADAGIAYFIDKVFGPTFIGLVGAAGVKPTLVDPTPGPASITQVDLGIEWEIVPRAGLKHTSGYTYMRNFLSQHVFSVEYDLDAYPDVAYVRSDAELLEIIENGKPAYVTLFFNPNNPLEDGVSVSETLTVTTTP